MRYSLIIKEKIRLYRFNGLSLNQIFDKTKIPKTTIRLWIKDINLSDEQLNILKKRTHEALQKGRIRAQSIRKNKRLEVEKKLLDKGKAEIGNLKNKEFFVAGVALYWAEGFKNKHERRLGFCNSDPAMIRFYIKWLKEIFKVNEKEIIARLTLNEAYKDRVNYMINYWSEKTGVPANQFTKTFYQTSKWKRVYNTENYRGVLRIHVKDSLNQLLKMRGWIEGLKSA